MVTKLLKTCLLVLISFVAEAQVGRYMIFFKNKTGTPFTISQPSEFLTGPAIARRSLNNSPVTEDDLPVNPAYVQEVRDAGATVYYTTRWMNGVLCEMDASLISTIEGISDVDHVEFIAPGAKPISAGRKSSGRGRQQQSNSGGEATLPQLMMLGIDEMHEDNYRGEGVVIAILDGGFPGVNTLAPFEDLRQDGRISSLSYDYVTGTSDIYHRNDHGTEVLSVISGFEDGVFTGGAYHATFELYITEDVASEYRVEEYNWLIAAERADSSGADIIQSSLGYNIFNNSAMDYTIADLDGQTAVITRAAQMAADRGILVVVSAGNEGSNSWKKVTPPADAVDLLAVGNAGLNGNRSFSSSIGPTADGRIKPDVMALGTATAVIKQNGSVGSSSGTSLAAPLITSLVAGLRQRYPGIGAKILLSAIRTSASHGFEPDNDTGYGVPHYRAIVNFLEHSEHEEFMVVFPNPADDTLNIRPFDPSMPEILSIDITDTQGRRLGHAGK